MLAEWPNPGSAPGPGNPGQKLAAGVAVAVEANAARFKLLQAAGMSAAAAAADLAGVEACGGLGPAGRTVFDSDWDPFHDDWHAW